MYDENLARLHGLFAIASDMDVCAQIRRHVVER